MARPLELKACKDADTGGTPFRLVRLEANTRTAHEVVHASLPKVD
jgi:hypothetical protein